MSSYSEEVVRRAADIREWLTKQVADKQEEIERLRTMLFLVDMLLKRGSFKTAASLESVTSSSTIKPSDESSTIAGYQQTREAVGNDNEDINAIRRAVVPTAEQQDNTSTSFTEVRQLRRIKDNLLLATATLSPTRLEITPVDGINLNVNTQPFKSFFLNRILEGMKARDVEKVNRGEIQESESLNYQIEEKDGTLIKKIMISNYREKERLNEIFNTSTWVLTRMMEKDGGK
ncbi:MAG TPA: hypothetical protein VK553_10710 [Candidatus Nitrosopolaris rasttigaisensis]|jgi:hypothetical protein|nr:hypothetical protein [Candidatus Nitrosopolaris rasttigaisensis]